MGFYQLKKTQILNQPIEKIWAFMADPQNLKKITPDYMGFDITTEISAEMYQGMIISYKVSPLLGIKTTWVTEITHIEEGKYFVDEQRIGPYVMWHHEHILEKHEKGTLMKDIVSYKPSFGFLGSIANSILIKRKLNEIFDYRTKILEEMFNQ